MHHPDRQGGSQKAFQRVTEAYDHLIGSIDKRRKQTEHAWNLAYSSQVKSSESQGNDL